MLTRRRLLSGPAACLWFVVGLIVMRLGLVNDLVVIAIAGHFVALAAGIGFLLRRRPRYRTIHVRL